MTDLEGVLLFQASQSSSDAELWRSDGTEAGTRQVKDINPGGNSFPDRLFGIGGAVYFAADDGTHGAELWRSDGTEAGTVLIGDLRPGPAGSAPADVVGVAEGAIVFTADDGAHGDELWRARDTIPPETSITAGPDGGATVGVPSATFGFASSERPATFECSLDGAVFAALHEPADDRRPARRPAHVRRACARRARQHGPQRRHAHLRRQPPRVPPPGRRPRPARAGGHACATAHRARPAGPRRAGGASR